MKNRLMVFRSPFDSFDLKNIATASGYNTPSQMFRDIERLIGKRGVPKSFEKKIERGKYNNSYRSLESWNDNFRNKVDEWGGVMVAVIVQAVQWLSLGNDLEQLDFPE